MQARKSSPGPVAGDLTLSLAVLDHGSPSLGTFAHQILDLGLEPVTLVLAVTKPLLELAVLPLRLQLRDLFLSSAGD